jgi:formate hydrogenlyase subunit 4
MGLRMNHVQKHFVAYTLLIATIITTIFGAIVAPHTDIITLITICAMMWFGLIGSVMWIGTKLFRDEKKDAQHP